MKFGFDMIGPAFSEEKTFEHCGDNNDNDFKDGRRSMGILENLTSTLASIAKRVTDHSSVCMYSCIPRDSE